MVVLWHHLSEASLCMCLRPPAAVFGCTGSQSWLERISSVLCFIPQVLLFSPLPTTLHLAESRMSHSMAGPRLLASSVVPSRSAGTKLTKLAEKFGVSALFAPEVLFWGSQRCKPPVPRWMQRGQALLIYLASAWIPRAVGQCCAHGNSWCP